MGSRRTSARAKPAARSTPAARSRAPFPWWASLAAIVLLALGWRLAYLARLAATPLLSTLRSDEQSYWEWATFLVDHGFRGTNAFFQGPLYPWLLAIIRSVSGAGVHGVLLVQCCWGALGVGLLADAARRLVGPRIALALGLLLAVNTMWVFMDGRILAESPLLALECLLVWTWARHRERGFGDAGNLGVGLLVGAMAQCRATQVTLLLPHALLLRRQRGLRPWVRGALISVFAFVLSALPSALWNASRAHEFIPFTYNGGFNLYVGNNPRANGGFVRIEATRKLGSMRAASPDGAASLDGRDYLRMAFGLTLSPAQSSAWWAGEAFRFMRTHPGRTCGLVLEKLSVLLSHDEVPQIEHLWTFERLAGPVGVPFLGSFLLLAVPGIAGLLVAARWGAVGEVVRAQFVVSVLAILPFFVTDRYRLHLLPPLALLAAMGVAATAQAIRAREPRTLRRLGVAAALALIVAWLPTGAVDHDYDRWLATGDLGVRWLEVGRASMAVPAFEEAIRMEAGLTAAADTNRIVRQDRADVHFNYGVALRALGRDAEAIAQMEQATSLDPTDAHYVRTLGDAYRARGREARADSLLARVPRLVAGDAEIAVSEGYRAAREGRLHDAVAAFERAVSLDATQYAAWGAMIRAQVLGGDVAAAQRTLARANEAGLPPVPAAVYEALVAASRGDSATTARALARVETDDLDPTLRSVAGWARERITRRP